MGHGHDEGHTHYRVVDDSSNTIWFSNEENVVRLRKLWWLNFLRYLLNLHSL